MERTATTEREPAAATTGGAQRIRVGLLIRSLVPAGAETQLAMLAKALDPTEFEVSVITFYDKGDLRADLEAAGIPVYSLRKSGRWDMAGFLYRALRLAKGLRLDILHGYMGSANVVVSLLKPALGRTAVVWGVRRADMDLTKYDWLVRSGFPLECALSRFADLVIANSQSGRDYHVQHGYPADRTIVVPNGVDTDVYAPDPAGRARVRSEWGIPPAAKLIGMAARLDPVKDHATFLKAAARVAARRGDVRFACIGHAEGAHADRMRALAGELGLEGRLVWAGPRRDMPAAYNALDIATLTSTGEGLPNVVLEAMACGIPCAVTDAGDSGWAVGDTGCVVPIGDDEAVAAAWLTMLDQVEADREHWSAAARSRACGAFSTARLKQATEDALRGLYARKARR